MYVGATRTTSTGRWFASSRIVELLASTAHAPQYRKNLAAAERGEFDILLVEDLSRLARDQVECERAIRRLEFRGIRIVATTDGYDSATRIGRSTNPPDRDDAGASLQSVETSLQQLATLLDAFRAVISGEDFVSVSVCEL